MKPTSKCDVEISITIDGMETVESVPECLQEVFLSNSPLELGNKLQNDVVLPRRYTQWVNNCSDSEKEDIGREIANDTMRERERDLGSALNWIKQEIMIMKEQDKDLLRQFVTLRSKILQLRCIYELNSSNSDTGSLGDSSTLSFDDIPDIADHTCSSLDTQMCDSDPGDIAEYSTRSPLSSLHIPGQHNTHPVTRIKWKSNEYL